MTSWPKTMTILSLLRCRECLPEEWFCGDCDVQYHTKRPLHNRDSIVNGLFKAIPPSIRISRGEDGQYYTHEQGTVWHHKSSCSSSHLFCLLPQVAFFHVKWNGAPATSEIGNFKYDMNRFDQEANLHCSSSNAVLISFVYQSVCVQSLSCMYKSGLGPRGGGTSPSWWCCSGASSWLPHWLSNSCNLY